MNIKKDIKDLVEYICIYVEVKGVKRFNFRVKLGLFIIKLGSKLLPLDCTTQIQLKNKKEI